MKTLPDTTGPGPPARLMALLSRSKRDEGPRSPTRPRGAGAIRPASCQIAMGDWRRDRECWDVGPKRSRRNRRFMCPGLVIGRPLPDSDDQLGIEIRRRSRVRSCGAFGGRFAGAARGWRHRPTLPHPRPAAAGRSARSAIEGPAGQMRGKPWENLQPFFFPTLQNWLIGGL